MGGDDTSGWKPLVPFPTHAFPTPLNPFRHPLPVVLCVVRYLVFLAGTDMCKSQPGNVLINSPDSMRPVAKITVRPLKQPMDRPVGKDLSVNVSGCGCCLIDLLVMPTCFRKIDTPPQPVCILYLLLLQWAQNKTSPELFRRPRMWIICENPKVFQ